MEVRKIQLVGNRSYATSLPKEWVLQNNLKPQDTITIEQVDNVLIINANEKGEKQTKIESFNLQEVEDVGEFITYCYEKNINNIRFFWKEYPFDKVKELKKKITYLEGYDIIQEDEGYIEVTFLFNDINITIHKIIRRKIYLLKILIDAIKQKEEQSIEDVEFSIDKLYLLAKRIIFASMRSQKTRSENKITFDEELFSYRDICKKIENIADVIYEIHKHEFTTEDFNKLAEIPPYVEQLIYNKKVNKMKRIFSEDTLTDTFFHRINKLTKDIHYNINIINFAHKHFK